MKTKTLPDGLLVWGDCLEWMRTQPDNSIDLTLGSPPYEDCRTYGIDFDLQGQDWVDWMVERWVEMDRITKGAVCMVVEGKTRNYQWSATPALLMADLHRKGIKLRKPPIYKRYGIPGSGGPDWLANLYECVVCSSKGRLPWSDNTAMGRPPKFDPGGQMTYRSKDGIRQDIKRAMREEGLNQREAARKVGYPMHTTTTGLDDSGSVVQKTYVAPDLANPGNIIDCGSVGRGGMGSDLCHEGEAPYPEYLAEYVIAPFCPKGGIVLDPFVGSGTTVAVARMRRRRFVGIDIRESQIKLTLKRLQEAENRKGFDLD